MPTPTLPTKARWVAAGLGLLALGAISVSFLPTVQAFAEPQGENSSSLVFGVPIGALTMSLAGAILVLAAAILARRLRDTASRNAPVASALIAFGVIGWWAAFALAADKVQLVLEPNADLSCNFSLLVQCGTNLESWQGSVFGFPNPLIGLVGWAAVIVVGCLLLTRARLASWFWITFNLGVAGALAFVIWLIGQSIFVLGTLCPWCLVTWAVTIPLFWAVTLGNAREGRFGARTARMLGPAYAWVPAITVGSYIVVAVVAQLRLDLLSYL